jgi:hypothetical protein
MASGQLTSARPIDRDFVDGVNEEMEQEKVCLYRIMGKHIQTRGLPRTGQCRMRRIYFGDSARKRDGCNLSAMR